MALAGVQRGGTRALCRVDVTVRGKGSQGRPDRQRGKRQNTSLKPNPEAAASSSKQEASRRQATRHAGESQVRTQEGRQASKPDGSKQSGIQLQQDRG